MMLSAIEGPPVHWGRRGRGVSLALLLGLALGPALGPSSARGEVSDSAKAEELIAKANELRRQGHDERALPLFREAYTTARTPRTAGQLGLVELALGYWDEANEYLTESLTAVRHHPWVDKNRAMLETAQQNARAHLADLIVEGAPAGADVLVNRRSVGKLPLPAALSVREGRVEMEVRATGYKSDVRVLTLAGKATTRVSVKLEPIETAVATTKPEPAAVAVSPASLQEAPSATAAESVAPPKGADVTSRDAGELPTWRRVLPWSLAAGAVLAGAFGVWQQVSSSHDLDKFDAIAGCGASAPMRGTDPRCESLYQSFSSERTRAFVGYGVAAALGAGAAGVLIWNAVNGPSAGPAPGATLIVGPRQIAFSLGSSF